MRAWPVLLLLLPMAPALAAPPPPSVDLLAVHVPLGLTFGAEGTTPAPLPPGAYRFDGRLTDGACIEGAPGRVDIIPVSSAFDVAAWVWNRFGSAPLPPDLNHVSGTTHFALDGSCQGGHFVGDDILVVPQGTSGQAFRAYLRVALTDGSGVHDVDEFPP